MLFKYLLQLCDVTIAILSIIKSKIASPDVEYFVVLSSFETGPNHFIIKEFHTSDVICVKLIDAATSFWLVPPIQAFRFELKFHRRGISTQYKGMSK